MTDVSARLGELRTAVADLLASAEASSVGWSIPRAPGKWSPSQVVEHCARALDESAHDVTGEPSAFPKLPRLVRPVVRTVFFNRVVKKGWFGRARTNRAMDPEVGAPTPAEARVRLETALACFEQACRSAVGPTMNSSVFGSVTIADYVTFQVEHTRHHRGQVASAILTGEGMRDRAGT